MSQHSNEVFLTGSQKEGNAYATYMAENSKQDFDVMFVEGTILSPECLIKIDDVPGFVQVKYDPDFIQSHPTYAFTTQPNQKGIVCVNGFKMKEKYCDVEVNKLFPGCTIETTVKISPASASAGVEQRVDFQRDTIPDKFEAILRQIQHLRDQGNVEQYQTKYLSMCDRLQSTIFPILSGNMGPIADVLKIGGSTFQDIMTTTFPMYNIQMPQVNQVRANAVLEFYEKYKDLGHGRLLDDFMEYGALSMNYDMDHVPALKLNFWPDELRPFLHRIQAARPKTFELIQDKASVYLIPKWSGRTPEVDQELEFRYSFSAVEILLAENRTEVERILNGVARSIYYRYLKREPAVEDSTKTILPSYFVKTTVLWMCELYNMNDYCAETDDPRTIAERMGREWLKYTLSLLREGHCWHYFIPGFDLFANCSTASLARAQTILEQEVCLDEPISLDAFKPQEEMSHTQQQRVEEWLGGLQVKTLKAAIRDYGILRENWLCPSAKGDDRGDASNCLYLLSQLRASDGDQQRNWNLFRRLFLLADQTHWLPAPWGEDVAECSVDDFVETLVAVGALMHGIAEAMNQSVSEETIQSNIATAEAFNFANVLQPFVQPPTSFANNLMTSWIPMFAQPFCGYNPIDRSSMQHRALVDNHPIGPLQNLLQGADERLTPLNPQGRQMYHQDAKNVSDQLMTLLHEAPDENMTLTDLIKYHQPPVPSSQPDSVPDNETRPVRATNRSPMNREATTLVIFDPNGTMDHLSDDFLRTINDYVVFYKSASSLLAYVQSITEEFVSVIVCQAQPDQTFLRQIENCSQIHAIFVYSEQEIMDEQAKRQHLKLIGSFPDCDTLFNQVRTMITQRRLSQIGFYDPETLFTIHTKLPRDHYWFIRNLLLKEWLVQEPSSDRHQWIQFCRNYYEGISLEMDKIQQFEEAYDPAHAHQWYLQSCFLSKFLNKAFQTFNADHLKMLTFFIHDLRALMTAEKNMDTFYCVRIVEPTLLEQLRDNVGRLMNFPDFVLVHRSIPELERYRSNAHMTVLFEIRGLSEPCRVASDADQAIIDLGATFHVNPM